MAFVSYKRPGWGIDWMDFAGGSPTAVIHDNQGSCTSPSWSPDGERIVFQSYRDGNPEIYRINIDGSDLTRLTNDPAKDFHPAWSPATQ
jgi:TolB protein